MVDPSNEAKREAHGKDAGEGNVVYDSCFNVV